MNKTYKIDQSVISSQSRKHPKSTSKQRLVSSFGDFTLKNENRMQSFAKS